MYSLLSLISTSTLTPRLQQIQTYAVSLCTELLLAETRHPVSASPHHNTGPRRENGNFDLMLFTRALHSHTQNNLSSYMKRLGNSCVLGKKGCPTDIPNKQQIFLSHYKKKECTTLIKTRETFLS